MNTDRYAEIRRSATELGVEFRDVPLAEAKSFIARALHKFRPYRTNGHLQVGDSHRSLPLDRYEFSYSEMLDGRPARIILDRYYNDSVAIEITDSRKVCSIFSNAFGIEYFLVDSSLRFMIAVNWYTVQIDDRRSSLLKNKLLRTP